MIYFAHPVAGTPNHPFQQNMEDARRLFRQAVLLGEAIGYDVVAPWMADVASFNDADPAEREMGMRRNFRFLDHCVAAWLWGWTVSTGMRKEAFHMLQVAGVEPPGMYLPGYSPEVYVGPVLRFQGDIPGAPTRALRQARRFTYAHDLDAYLRQQTQK